MIRRDLVALVVWLGLLALAAAVRWRERRGHKRPLRSARAVLVLYVLLASGSAALVRVDLWPLSSWMLMTGTPEAKVGAREPILELVAVDVRGREHPLDFRSVEPMAFDELRAWMRGHFFTLPLADRDRAAAWLLSRVNVASARVRAGASPSTAERWLGSARAPYHVLHPRWWQEPSSVPTEPFVALRVYREWWTLADRARDTSAVRRSLVYDSQRSRTG